MVANLARAQRGAVKASWLREVFGKDFPKEWHVCSRHRSRTGVVYNCGMCLSTHMALCGRAVPFKLPCDNMHRIC